MKKQTKTAYIFFILLVFFAVAAYMPIPQEGEEYPAWYKDWGVPEGFAITKDSGGYSLPTFIVFVPEPGDGPKDPLYYVAELRGKIKVVTNDRTVKNFANPGKFPQIEKERSVERIEDEFGLTGLCLSPEKGYLFATFVYYKEGQLYNNIARFETTPGTFSLKPSNNVLMGEIFSDFPTGVSHQIGGCQVDGNHLYVSVGEGQLYELPHSLETPLGKVLRFTLYGE
ncbi:MAG: PQQ-dependent sugar dehydrogenase, partial [Anaerolineae bacterium]|nr:PQQ-dependent sugar dehydrogenase [Anaerolineae bacterium]